MSVRAQTTKMEFAPGFVADDTPLAAEGGYVDGNLIRFRRGRAEVWGGWEKLTESRFEGVARGGAAWANLDGEARLAFGTSTKLYGYWNKTGTAALYDITPPVDIKRLVANPFTPVSVGSAAATVSQPAHGYSDGDQVFFSGTLTSINGYRTISNVTTDTYRITADSVFASTTPTGSVGDANPVVEYRAQPGNADAPGLRTWSVDNFGESLVALPNGGGLFIGNLGNAVAEALSNGSFTGGLTDWAVSNGTSWTGASNQARITTTSGGGAVSKTGNLSQNISDEVVAGRVYRLFFDYGVYQETGSAFTSASIGVSVNDANDSLIEIVSDINMSAATAAMISYSVTFVMPADPKDIVFSGAVSTPSAAAASLRLDNVSLQEVPVAYVEQAPETAQSMFVDPNRIVVLCGTVEADGDYNPMLVRWSDQENVRAWVPDTDNLAGEYPLAKGGRIVAGMATRQQNLIFTDSSLYSMIFTGSADDVFSFNLLGTGCGLIASHAVAEYNGIAFWMANDKNFYIFQGGVPQTIDCPDRDYVFDALNTDHREKICCGVNSAFNEVVWFYPRGEETECSHYVAFNWVEKHWAFGELGRTTWLPSGVFDKPIGFSPDRYIFSHESGTQADGARIPWSLTTSYFDIEDGGNILSILRYIPDFERQIGNIKISFNYRYRPNGEEINFGPYVVTPATLDVPLRHSGRQAQIKWEGADNSEFVRFGIQALDVIKTGARR
jgi:hypothetical protein